MLFRNLQIIRFTKEFNLTAEQLEQQLSDSVFSACGSQQLSSYGWVAPLNIATQSTENSPLVHAANNKLMICAQKEERILPASVIREQVESEASQIEESQARRVFPSEKRRLKDEAIQQLLPKAFTKSQLTYAYIDLSLQVLIIDASSPKKAEELMILLRKSIGSLPVVPVIMKQSPSKVMSHWLLNSSLPSSLELGSQCELRDISDTAVILRCKGLDLQSDEFLSHVSSGMEVIKLELEWKEHCQFVIKEDLSIGRLRFNDLLSESLDDLDKDDLAGRFDADFAIMTGELAQLMPLLFDAFGGIDTNIS